MSSVKEYQLQAVWSIKKETFMNMTKYNEIDSETFKTTLPGIKYTFTMQGGSTHVAIWISSAATTKKMKLFISSANFEGDLAVESIIDPDNDVECENMVFLKREDFLNPEKKFFVNDILTIEIRGILCYEENKIDLGKLLWNDNENKDFTIIVGNEKIKIHKILIRQYSSVIAKHLNKNQMKVENFDKSIVNMAVALCYGQTNHYYFRERSPKEGLFKLIKFTDAYDMPLIKEQVELKLKESIRKENVCELANESIEYKCDKLRSFCVNFISNCIKTGKPFDGFADLQPEIVHEVFKNTICHTGTS